MKNRLVERVVKKEWVVGGKANNAHNPVVECRVFVEEVVGQFNVVRGLKASEQKGGYRW